MGKSRSKTFSKDFRQLKRQPSPGGFPGLGFQGAFPYFQHFPAGLLKGLAGGGILSAGGGYFCLPKGGAGFGHYKIPAAGVAMPKAAMNKEDGFVTGEYNIGAAGQAFYIQAVAVALGMQPAAHQHFGPGIPAFDGLHIAAAGSGIVYIGHGLLKVAGAGQWAAAVPAEAGASAGTVASKQILEPPEPPYCFVPLKQLNGKWRRYLSFSF
jgi:hypothetical protein